jgi:hypothetical protein
MSNEKSDNQLPESNHDAEHRSPELTFVQPNTRTNGKLTVHSLRSGLALAGAAVAYFATVGFLNAFGIFQEYYASTILRDHSDFQISWVRGSPISQFDGTWSKIEAGC